MSDLYKTDIVEWADKQARALRRHATNEIDWDNVAEEIEDLAARQRREVRRRLRRICEHLLKWRHLPLQHSRSGEGWKKTLVEQRRELMDLLEESPSLCKAAEDALQSQFVNARQDVEGKTGRSLGLPDDVCPWTLKEVLSLDFLPHRDHLAPDQVDVIG
jgi:hypothetical protein